jgi:Na+/citrate or Na+/malate symporter
VVTSLSVTIAAFLLACPIVILYFVTNPDARLALVITFIVFFALGISVTTSANRDAIFAATAAYAAVLVVFVSGDLANTKWEEERRGAKNTNFVRKNNVFLW